MGKIIKVLAMISMLGAVFGIVTNVLYAFSGGQSSFILFVFQEIGQLFITGLFITLLVLVLLDKQKPIYFLVLSIISFLNYLAVLIVFSIEMSELVFLNVNIIYYLIPMTVIISFGLWHFKLPTPALILFIIYNLFNLVRFISINSSNVSHFQPFNLLIQVISIAYPIMVILLLIQDHRKQYYFDPEIYI